MPRRVQIQRQRQRGTLITAGFLVLGLLSGCAQQSDPAPTAAAPQEASEETEEAYLPVELSEPDVNEEENSMPAESGSTEYNPLSEDEARVILGKGTEPPDSFLYKGEYTELMEPGTYVCRRCNSPLYESDSKFHSGCGWPAFDDEIDGAVERHVDPDGRRIEITCKNCGGHLGHVFEGEGFTEKDTRHCVNSVSMRFYAKGTSLPAVIRPQGK